MNAYTAALSVALPDCRVLTSSRDIHSFKNDSLAWKKAPKKERFTPLMFLNHCIV